MVDAQDQATRALRPSDHEAALRVAQRLLRIGLFWHDPATGRVTWSDAAAEILETYRAFLPTTFDQYVETVIAADRGRVQEARNASLSNPLQLLDVSHRIVRADGTIAHIRVAAEMIATEGREIAFGIVQDVTADTEKGQETENAVALLRLAGEGGPFGGWRINLQTKTVDWTEGTAQILDVPNLRTASLDYALDFYPVEDRARLRAHIDACAQEGIRFDDIFQICTASNTLVWVRAIGEAVRDLSGDINAIHGSFHDISAFMHAKEQAEESSVRLRQVLETMSEGFISLDASMRTTFINSRAIAYLEPVSEDIVGQRPRDVFTNEIGELLERQCQCARHEGHLVSFDLEVGAQNRILRAGAYPQWDGVALYLRDVTEERAKQKQIDLLGNAMEHLSDAITITEVDDIDNPGNRRLIYVNDAFLKMNGCERSDVIGITADQYYSDNAAYIYAAQINNDLTIFQRSSCVVQKERKDGTVFWMSAEISPIRDATGAITHYVAADRDVTERVEMQKQLDLLGNAMEQLADSIAITEVDKIDDPNTRRVVYVNSAFEKLTGYTKNEIIGITAAQYYSTEQSDGQGEKIRDTLKDGKSASRRVLNQRKDGSLYWKEAEISPIRNSAAPLRITSRRAVM